MPGEGPITTSGLPSYRNHPIVSDGARAWANKVPYNGSSLTGLSLQHWQWGWRDAEQGYRQQFKDYSNG